MPRSPPPPAAIVDSADVAEVVGTVNLAECIRRYGHLAATLDPLGSAPVGDPSLAAPFHGVSDGMLARLPASLVGGPVAAASANALEAITALRRIYCSTTGYDYSHVFVPEERDWLRHAAETCRFRPPVQPIDDVDAPRSPEPGRSLRAVPAPRLPRQDPLLDRRPGPADPGPRRDPGRRRRRRRIGRAARHGAPRPPQRAGARAVEAVRADPGRVQGSGAGPRRVTRSISAGPAT